MEKVENVSMPTPEKKPEQTIEQTEVKQESKFYDEAFVMRLMNEKKAAVARAREFEQIAEQREREKMMAQENWKALYEEEQKKSTTWQEKYEQQNSVLINAAKQSAVKKELVKLGIQDTKAEKVLKLVDFKTLDYDRDSGVVSGASIAAKSIAEDYPELFGPSRVGVNQSATQGLGAGELTLEAWKKLPYDERKKLEPELYKTLGVKRT